MAKHAKNYVDLKEQPIPEGSHLLEVDNLKMYFHTQDGVVHAVDGVSYTLETVKAIYSLFPVEGTLGFLMGDDLLAGLERWYGYEELVKLVHFVCLTRGGAVAHPAGACVEFLSVAPLRASSTAVRSGEEGEGLEKVRAYIEEHGLYYAGRNREGG